MHILYIPTVASAPTIISLEQISAIAVRMEWSQPSEGATVTGYVVHYTDGDTDWTESVAASSTSSDITHLTSGFTYTISVEATSQHLSGESDEWTITMGELISHVQCIKRHKHVVQAVLATLEFTNTFKLAHHYYIDPQLLYIQSCHEFNSQLLTTVLLTI